MQRCVAPAARCCAGWRRRSAAQAAAHAAPARVASASPAPLRRRVALASLCAAALLPLARGARADAPPPDAAADTLAALQAEAATAFAAQDFAVAERALTQLIALQPGNASWQEGRAQVRVDAKRFDAALMDYGSALALVAPGGGDEARLRAGRALALEGLARWQDALADYDAALAAAEAGGFRPDPYVLNGRGNALASLQRWADARTAYQAAAATFQASAGYRRGASTTSRLDGAIYASANAALMRAQQGDDDGAAAELAAVARRAPNSADARAALAALRWAAGRRADAEEAWVSACARADGCARYKDLDFVRRIRRWPPRMVAHLEAFLQLRDETSASVVVAAAV